MYLLEAFKFKYSNKYIKQKVFPNIIIVCEQKNDNEFERAK